MAKARIDVDFSGLSPGFRRFVKERTAEAVKRGMSVVVRKGKTVRGETGACGGICSECELKVAWAGAQSVGSLVHEFCHAEQVFHAPKMWEVTIVRSKDCIKLIDEWINGEVELSNARLRNYFFRLVTLERDCERRVLRNIDAYRIEELDREDYTKDANCYLMFHAEVMRAKRRWLKPAEYCASPENMARVPNDRLYTVKEILAMMP